MTLPLPVPTSLVASIRLIVLGGDTTSGCLKRRSHNPLVHNSPLFFRVRALTVDQFVIGECVTAITDLVRAVTTLLSPARAALVLQEAAAAATTAAPPPAPPAPAPAAGPAPPLAAGAPEQAASAGGIGLLERREAGAQGPLRLISVREKRRNRGGGHGKKAHRS